MIGGVVGLLTLLLALVLGLLIWTAYGVFSTQQTELQTIAARALEFDLEMRQYGPEGDKAREILRRDLVWAHEQFWGTAESASEAYDASFKAMSDMSSYFDSLKPTTPAQTHLLDEARRNYAFIGENRLLMSLQAETPVSWPLIYAVTAWSCLMFGGMGLSVAAERDHRGDARPRRRFGGARDLSHPRVQQALHQLNSRFPSRPRAGDRPARPAERRKSERRSVS